MQVASGAELALGALTRQIEALFPSVVGPADARAATGEPYVVIGDQMHGAGTVPGAVDAGQPAAFDWTIDEAIARAVRMFERYADGRTGTLYWRRKPEMIDASNGRGPFRVYMRLLITDRQPVLLASETNADV